MEPSIHPQTVIGHAHLKVSNLERAVKFYTEVLGFEVTSTWGTSAAFLSAGGYHHHLGLNTWESLNGSPPPPRSTGLFHVAILYPNRKALATAVQRLFDHQWNIDGTADHGVSEAIYLRDPDNNGLELYCDRHREDWQKDSNGSILMVTKPLDIDLLLAELQAN